VKQGTLARAGGRVVQKGPTMARRVMISLFLIGVFGLTYLGYRHWSENQAMATGDVFPAAVPGATAPASAQPTQPIVYPPAKSSVAALPAAAEQALSQRQRGASAAAPSKAAAGLAADTINPNPPNGIVFAGSGRFQVYRQGSLTWRLDTDTGQTCILFATNAEWRKPQVYRHGCGAAH
jgi:hypothetical protein